MGSNNYGEIGIDEKYSQEPQLLFPSSNAVSVCCGWQFSLVLISKINMKINMKKN